MLRPCSSSPRTRPPGVCQVSCRTPPGSSPTGTTGFSQLTCTGSRPRPATPSTTHSGGLWPVWPASGFGAGS
eukprot:6860296-Alexandrium_andersonii.AAC.1